MLIGKNLTIAKRFGDKIEFTIARFHCIRFKVVKGDFNYSIQIQQTSKRITVLCFIFFHRLSNWTLFFHRWTDFISILLQLELRVFFQAERGLTAILCVVGTSNGYCVQSFSYYCIPQKLTYNKMAFLKQLKMVRKSFLKANSPKI